MIENLRVDAMPALREPVLVAGFGGWNDAANAATYALTSLIAAWTPRRFAEIDPEEYFDFTSTRPTIVLAPDGQRRVQWPSNVFYAQELPETRRDAVLLLGTEPELKWRHFTSIVVDLARELDVSCLITLGGLLADVPHTSPTRLSGFGWPPGLMRQLESHGVELSTYEGPTGIIGALHDAWRGTEKPSMSLWASVPHYISATPNPQASLALLQRLAAILGVSIPRGALEVQAEAFGEKVEEALQENPEAQEYVRQLEEQIEDSVEAPGPELFDELEDFLRTNRGDGGSD